MPELLRADGVTVGRGRTTLLEDFSLRLEAGELVHLRGANGCGKSSLMRVLAGVVEPRRGSVVRTGRCEYVPERVTLPESLPARRWLRVCGAGDAELPSELDRRCGALSNGQQQRVVLIAAMAGRSSPASIHLLDEPWAGLDVDARDALDANLTSVIAHGAAVIYTDHGHETALVPSRTLDLTEGGFEPAGSDAPPRVELRRGCERTQVVISDRALAERLSNGWEVERVYRVR